MMRRWWMAVLAALGCWILSSPAHAFDYLEHSYFTDRACLEAQRVIGEQIERGEASDELAAKYIALSLTCPETWKSRYCRDGWKTVEGNLNRLDGHPVEDGEWSATLGDLAALPDHMSRYGPIRGYDRVGDAGLTVHAWEWIVSEPDGVGGVIGDVAEDSCETDGLAPWQRLQDDIDASLQTIEQRGTYPAIPDRGMSPGFRASIPRGPTDPAGAYSFDNPHYLDLVLRNHHHFGAQAFSSWLGFHGAAVDVSGRSCSEHQAFDEDELEDLADDLPDWADVDWDDLTERELADLGCEMLRDAVRVRIRQWSKRAAPGVVAPVESELRGLEGDGGQEMLDRIVSALSGLVMEGTGLHFLQDGLAGGHMRTIRSKEQLDEVRYDHDVDNREGVAALLNTRAGIHPFIAFGDSYLMGPAETDRVADCDWDAVLASDDPELVSACLVQHQRGLLVSTTTASLVDWAHGGTLYEASDEPREQALDSCEVGSPARKMACRLLPVTPTFVVGEAHQLGQVVQKMYRGSIPVPPPNFHYESLSFGVGFEATGDATQLGLTLNFLEELDDRANWMTSHQVGLRATIGDAELNQFLANYAYGFHWRWAARFLVEARAGPFVGLRDLNAGVNVFTGIVPEVGVTALPEGWTKIPLEITLAYRLPIEFYASDAGFFGEGFADEHWIFVGLGLAFM